MKKAFDANVSRSKPRVRLSNLMPDVETIAQTVAFEQGSFEPPPAPAEALAEEVKARATQAQQPKPTAVEAVREALAAPVVEQPSLPLRPAARTVTAPVAPAPAVVAHAEAPDTVIEVQTPSAPVPFPEEEISSRRERLKERLKAVRENPRPEPLPETVAEAGVLAVERISSLQTEVAKVRAVNLALTQDLEVTRRQAERATEEARARMDEARRLASEMESRVRLLSDLEKELAALEVERNESLLALQEARQVITVQEKDKSSLQVEIQKHAQALADSLSEEERLACELEESQEHTNALRKTTDTLRNERDTLARQVADLTKERAELLEARRALEAVHRALSHAVAR